MLPVKFFKVIIEKNGGVSIYRGLVDIKKSATGSVSKLIAEIGHHYKQYFQMDPVQIFNACTTNDALVAHEASVGKISEEALFYLMSHGIPEDEAKTLIVR